MAITKLLRIKENKQGSNKSAGLHRAIVYICNPAKTEGGLLVSGNAGGNPELIYEAMRSNKESYCKTEGSQGFHYVISFHPDEPVTHQMAMQIANEFVEELLHGQHIYVVAVHTDTDHVHSHLVFDSVNFETGYKFHSGQYDWLARIQPITDSLCRKYGLSTLSYDPDKERDLKNHRDWEEYNNRNEIKETVTWSDIIRDDIDTEISQASDWDDFLNRLQAMHYTIKDGKYLSLQPDGKERAVRSVRLGPGYSKEDLQERIGKPSQRIQTEGQSYKVYGDTKRIYQSSLPYVRSGRGFSPMQEQWYRRVMRLRHFRHPGFSGGYRYKKDVVQLGRLTDQMVYLFNNDITSYADVRSRISALRERGSEASAERKLLKGICYTYERSHLPDDILFDPEAHDVPMPDLQSIYQIRINQTLYGEGTDLIGETFTVRLPGTEEYLRLYSDDSRVFNEGQTISSYIYADAEYQIEDSEGHILHRATGEVVKDKFKAREVNRDKDKVQKGEIQWTRK